MVRTTDAELASDIHAVLAKVPSGVEAIVEQDQRPVAVIKMQQGPGRRLYRSGEGVRRKAWLCAGTRCRLRQGCAGCRRRSP